MSGYPKFMKELVTKKRTLECEMIEVSHNCNVILTKYLVAKKEDPDVFTILCAIGACKFGKVLGDLGASINLITLAILEELILNTISQMTMRLLMVDQSIKKPIRILHYVLVKVDKFILPMDFVILDCKVNVDVIIILNRHSWLSRGHWWC